jgi:hypothetical protein
MLYLVSGRIEETHYMVDKPKKYSAIRLVNAESENEAEAKFVKHFHDQTKDYDVYFYATADEANPVIE